MKQLAKASLVLFVLVLVVLPAEASDRGKQSVVAVLTLRFDAESQVVVWPEVKAILESSPRDGWTGDLPEVLAGDADTYRSVAIEREDTDDPGVLAIKLRLESKAPEIRADQVLDALVRRLEAHLREQHQAERDAMAREVQGIQKRLEELTKSIEAIRGEGALPWPLSAAAFFEALIERRQELSVRLAELSLEERALKARRGALVDRLAVLAEQEEKAKGTTQAERVLAEVKASLDTIVKLREQELSAVEARLGAGKESPEAVLEARAALENAKLQRADVVAELTPPARSAKRMELESQQAALAVDQVVLEATRKHLQQMKDELDQEIAQRRGAILPVTNLEEESQAFRDRLLGLTQSLSIENPPRVSVLRMD